MPDVSRLAIGIGGVARMHVMMRDLRVLFPARTAIFLKEVLVRIVCTSIILKLVKLIWCRFGATTAGQTESVK